MFWNLKSIMSYLSFKIILTYFHGLSRYISEQSFCTCCYAWSEPALPASQPYTAPTIASSACHRAPSLDHLRISSGLMAEAWEGEPTPSADKGLQKEAHLQGYLPGCKSSPWTCAGCCARSEPALPASQPHTVLFFSQQHLPPAHPFIISLRSLSNYCTHL